MGTRVVPGVFEMREAPVVEISDELAPRRGPRPVRSETPSVDHLIHGLNNALTVVLTTSSLLSVHAVGDSALADDLRELKEASRRATLLLAELANAVRNARRKA